MCPPAALTSNILIQFYWPSQWKKASNWKSGAAPQAMSKEAQSVQVSMSLLVN